MPLYSYAPTVDGEEYPVTQREAASVVQAIAHGATVLRAVVATKPAQAFVAVWCGPVEDGEPLGAWDWSAEQPDLVWAADS